MRTVLGFEIEFLSKESKGTIKKLEKTLQKYKDREVFPTKCHNGNYLSFKLGLFERLVIRVKDNKMFYCTHEKYNTIIEKR